MKDSIQYYSQHTDERREIKVKKIMKKFGKAKAYGMYTILKDMLREEKDFKIDISNAEIWEVLGDEYGCNPDAVKKFIEYGISIDLFQTDGQFLECRLFYEKGVKQLIENRLKKSEGGKKGMETRWGKKDNVINLSSINQ